MPLSAISDAARSPPYIPTDVSRADEITTGTGDLAARSRTRDTPPIGCTLRMTTSASTSDIVSSGC